MATDADDAARLAVLGEGSVSRDRSGRPRAGTVRREVNDEIAAEHGFDPSEVASRLGAFVKQAGKETVDQRRRAGPGGGAGPALSRSALADRGTGAPLPRPGRSTGRHALAGRLEPEDVFVLADPALKRPITCNVTSTCRWSRLAVPRPQPADRAKGGRIRLREDSMTRPRDVDSGSEPIHPFPAWTREPYAVYADQYYQAGVQRMEQAWEIYHCGNAYALAMYCGGLAVECLLSRFGGQRTQVSRDDTT